MTEKKPEDKFTIRELHARFNGFTRVKNHGTVLIKFKGSFIELKEDFVHQLKRELDLKIKLASSGIEDLSKSDIFTIYILEDSY